MGAHLTRMCSCQDPKKEHGTELQPFLHQVEVMHRHASECVDRSRGANFICLFLSCPQRVVSCKPVIGPPTPPTPPTPTPTPPPTPPTTSLRLPGYLTNHSVLQAEAPVLRGWVGVLVVHELYPAVETSFLHLPCAFALAFYLGQAKPGCSVSVTVSGGSSKAQTMSVMSDSLGKWIATLEVSAPMHQIDTKITFFR
jgi:hypothetical protein